MCFTNLPGIAQSNQVDHQDEPEQGESCKLTVLWLRPPPQLSKFTPSLCPSYGGEEMLKLCGFISPK
jgi:hypothetical protein